MGLIYLDGKSWAEITRDERFFCAHLFNLIRGEGETSFVHYLNTVHELGLDANWNWEIAYEACFYRDLWQYRGRKGPLFSPKRTFDLCLLSDNAIVVIEAKAHQEFYIEQLDTFEKDKSQLKEETGVGTVLLSGLASSKYDIPQEVRSRFDGPYLTWLELARHYDNDAILLRADSIYQPGGVLSYGNNNVSGYMTGSELAEASARGEEFMVGRSGGLKGPDMLHDITSGEWQTQKYETNREATDTINRNWFWLSEFMEAVREYRQL